jgi:hypothetical protein
VVGGIAAASEAERGSEQQQHGHLHLDLGAQYLWQHAIRSIAMYTI